MPGPEFENEEARRFLNYMIEQNLQVSTKDDLLLSYSIYREKLKPSTVTCSLHYLLLALKRIHAIKYWKGQDIEWCSGVTMPHSDRVFKEPRNVNAFDGTSNGERQMCRNGQHSDYGCAKSSVSFMGNRKIFNDTGERKSGSAQEEKIVWVGKDEVKVVTSPVFPSLTYKADSANFRKGDLSTQQFSEENWNACSARNNEYSVLQDLFEKVNCEGGSPSTAKNKKCSSVGMGRNGVYKNSEASQKQNSVTDLKAGSQKYYVKKGTDRGTTYNGMKDCNELKTSCVNELVMTGNVCPAMVGFMGKGFYDNHKTNQNCNPESIPGSAWRVRGIYAQKLPAQLSGKSVIANTAVSDSWIEDPQKQDSKKRFVNVWMATQEMQARGIFISGPFSLKQDQPQTIDVGGIWVTTVSVFNNNSSTFKLWSVQLLYTKPNGSFSLALLSHAGEGCVSNKTSDFLNNSMWIRLTNPSMLPSSRNVSSISSSDSSISGPFSLQSGSHLSLQLACKAKYMGYHTAAIVFDFGEQKIVRYATLMAQDEVAVLLARVEAYSRQPLEKSHGKKRFIPGRPPPVPGFAKPLGRYQMSSYIRHSLVKESAVPVFFHGLSFDTYQEYFSCLMYAEELQWEVDIRAYDMQNVTMNVDNSGYIVLRVAGLLERRPSVIFRDQIFVKPLGSKEEYQGFVYKVQAEEVFLKFHNAFHKSFIAKKPYDVRFSYSRITIRRSLQAINASKHLPKNFLFPHKFIPLSLCDSPNSFIPFNRTLNEEQKISVQEIVKRVGAPPYLICGPPGTGKTVTIVEAILQILKYRPGARILACAPSNSASDILLDRLKGCVQVMELLRLNAYTRPVDDVMPQLFPYCRIDGSQFSCPSQQELLKYKVVISTYWSAALFQAQDVRRGHFSHIFLDEAGQGMEPETLVAIANILSRETVVVLAGDHLQLGPVVRSPVAEKFGLGKSFMERLSYLPLYSGTKVEGKKTLQFNKGVVTKLVRNYRSHPAILDLPSHLFYDEELIACAPEDICTFLCGWEELPNKNFPVLFIGIDGRDEREGTSPSWFNAQEASKVIEIVGKLKERKQNPVSDNDIGIISPYSQQVKKIKAGLALKNMKGIKVGSVEQFQGQEKTVIIISTVRSSKEFIEADQCHNIGFLKSPKRFNVAITRAKALLVVIGNPYVLCKDEHWGELLHYCTLHKSYIGCPPPSEENTLDDQNFLNFMDENFSLEMIQNECVSSVFSDFGVAEETQWPDGRC